MIKKLFISVLILFLPGHAFAATTTTIFLTSGTSWTVPTNWNPMNNTVECIGPGGNGAVALSTQGGTGGGGGAYAKVSNLSLTGTISYVVGTGGSGNDTYFNGAASSTASLSCAPGTNGTSLIGGLGGKTVNGTGTIKKAGGDSKDSISGDSGGTGGGGAGSKNGDGAATVSPIAVGGGVGGGGSGGGTVGAAVGTGNGGDGGNNSSGSGHGVGSTSGGVDGTAGTAGGGGGGGSGATFGVTSNGGAGGPGTEWDGTHGSGGGGGGGGGIAVGSTAGKNGGNGGLYGGGAAGGGRSLNGTPGNGGTGANGIIVITYIPHSEKVNTSQNNTLTSGLVGLWSFDGKDMAGVTAYDRSGQGHNGTLTSGPTRVVGKIGQALNFNGSTNFVALGTDTYNSIMSGKSAVSVSFWIKPTSYNNAGNRSRIIDLQLSAGSNAFLVDFPTGDNNLEIAGRSISSDTLQSKTGTPVSLGVWTHIVGVLDFQNSRILVYKNGSLLSSTGVSFGASTYTASSGATDSLGQVSGQQFYNGILDDVRVYNRALSATQVKQLYNLGGSKVNTSQNLKTTNGLVGLWSFDAADMAGVTAYDRSGSGNNGTLTNGPTKTIGKIGQGLDFNGTNQYVNANTSLSGGAPYTVSLWVKNKATQNNTDPAFFSNQNAFTLILGMEPATSKLFFAGATFFTGTYASVISNTNWQHFTYVLTGSVISLYINGVYITQSSFTSPAVTSIDIGDIMSSHGTYNYKGSIDDVRVYNRALSATEIKQLYLSGK